MKFQKIHLFVILLLSLVFCGCLGSFVREGMTNQEHSDTSDDNEHNTNVDSFQSSASLPEGVHRSDIPPGQQDMYILKSEVVPPVCPRCPQAAACPRQEKCPPCPSCARCPEPAFECKKVPNYASSNDNYLPRPVLADFSQFGM
jgi:hypothetical protein